MLERCKTAQERWGGVHDIIDRWLKQRQHLIETWVELRDLEEYTQMDTPKIQHLCELLVDYVSVGHFNVYEQLALEAQEFKDDSALKMLNELMPEIDESTAVALEFNDKYDTQKHVSAQLEALPCSMKTLAVVMAERFQLEDRLIEELHEAHSEKSA